MNLKSPALWGTVGTLLMTLFGASLVSAGKVDVAEHWLQIVGGVASCVLAGAGGALAVVKRLKAGGSVTPGDIDIGGKP